MMAAACVAQPPVTRLPCHRLFVPVASVEDFSLATLEECTDSEQLLYYLSCIHDGLPAELQERLDDSSTHYGDVVAEVRRCYLHQQLQQLEA